MICPACRQALTIHCGSVTCTWLECRTPACIWVLYAPRQRRRKDRGGRVWTYQPEAETSGGEAS